MPKGNRRSRGTATILDVASAAGVSSMTVSRVVNGAANVRQSTRDLVLEAIARLNYSPNTAARSLAAGHATHIGLFYANPSDAYLTQFLIGALEGARRAGCHVVLAVCAGETAEEQAASTRAFVSSGVEGVILAPPVSEYASVHTELAAAGIPVVSVAMHPGLFWPRRTFRKYPGHIKVRILPPIEPGMDPDAFFARLIEETEKASDELLVETIAENPHLPVPPTAARRLAEIGKAKPVTAVV